MQSRALHPFLFALFPSFFVYFHNTGIISFSDLVISSLLFLGLVSFLVIVANFLIRNMAKSSILISALLLLAVFYTPLWLILGMGAQAFNISTAYLEVFVVCLLLLFFLAAIILVKKKSRAELRPTTFFLNVFSAILLITSAANGALIFFKSPKISINPTEFQSEDISNKPNIYFILLDAYGRQDSLQTLTGFDNTKFINTLKTKGFYVADKSNSNYPQTISSLAATLNYDYLQDLLPEINPNYVGRRPLMQLINESKVFRFLKAQGYETVSFETGVADIETYSTDLHLSRPYSNPLLDEILSQVRFPLIEIKLSSYLYRKHRERIEQTLQFLKNEVPLESPKFVYAHIMLPHPPFIYKANGEFFTPNKPFSYGDGDHYGETSKYRRRYVGQLKYTNGQILQIVDAIQKREPNSVIIIQGDHGPGLNYHMTQYKPGKCKDRFSILNAIYLPSGTEQLYPEISSVNTFRVVFNSLFKRELELLEDKSYFTGYFKHYTFIDVTKEVH